MSVFFCLFSEQKLDLTLFLFVFFFIWVLRPDNIISLILNQVSRKVGRKWGIPEKTHLTTRKQKLACLTCDPSEVRTHSGEMTSDLER